MFFNNSVPQIEQYISTKKLQESGLPIRTVNFNLMIDKQKFVVLASPAPDYLEDILSNQLLTACKNCNYTTFVSLQDSPYLDAVISASDHLVLNISDMGRPNIREFISAFFNDNATLNITNNLFLHCGAGLGRTGTILAVFKIMEILQSKFYIEPISLDNLKNELNIGSQKEIFLSQDGFYSVPKLIYEAITNIRVMNSLTEFGKIKPDLSVESIEQISFLIDFTIKYSHMLKQKQKIPSTVEENKTYQYPKI